MKYKTYYNSPLGVICLASDGKRLTGLWNEGQKYHGEGLYGCFMQRDDLPIFDMAKNWLDRYFNKENPPICDVPICMGNASKFRQSVWQILCEIPYGEVLTYGGIAKVMAKKLGLQNMSSQAVGGAVGHNTISIIVPCHRVVGSSGSLTGYAGGIGIKVKLLELEGVDMNKYFVPTKGTAL